MVVTSLPRRIVSCVLGLLVAFAALAFAEEAQATVIVLYYQPTVSGGSFVNPSEVMDTADRVSFPPDRMSFSVSGDFQRLGRRQLVDGGGIPIYTALLTPDLQNSFVVNTSIDGTFAYIPSGSGPAPTLTTFAATSDLQDIGGTATVKLAALAGYPFDGTELSDGGPGIDGVDQQHRDDSAGSRLSGLSRTNDHDHIQ